MYIEKDMYGTNGEDGLGTFNSKANDAYHVDFEYQMPKKRANRKLDEVFIKIRSWNQKNKL